MIIDWRYFKQLLDQKSIYPQYTENSDIYFLKAYDSGILLAECQINKNLNIEDKEEFEAGYKALSNSSLGTPKDSDGSVLMRNKITTLGWHLHLHCFEFELSKLDSLYSKDVDGVDYNFINMKFYEMIEEVETLISGENLNQQYLDSNCIKTIVDWEPTYDYEIVGGMLRQPVLPSDDVRLWLIGVPDVPVIAGGSKPFVSGVNLKYIGTDGLKSDGRTAKKLTYNEIYHTNKLRLIFRHPAGFKHKVQMLLEVFKE